MVLVPCELVRVAEIVHARDDPTDDERRQQELGCPNQPRVPREGFMSAVHRHPEEATLKKDPIEVERDLTEVDGQWVHREDLIGRDAGVSHSPESDLF